MKVPSVGIINFQSDGPSTQYKNKSNFHLFKFHCEKFELQSATWNFTTSGHGKSYADGIGGTVKCMCDRTVGFGQDILSAQDVINTVVSNRDSKVNMYLISQEEIEKIDSVLPGNLKPAPNSNKIHQLIWNSSEKHKLFLNYLSCYSCKEDPPCKHYALQPNQYSVLANENKNIVKSKDKVGDDTVKITRSSRCIESNIPEKKTSNEAPKKKKRVKS